MQAFACGLQPRASVSAGHGETSDAAGTRVHVGPSEYTAPQYQNSYLYQPLPYEYLSQQSQQQVGWRIFFIRVYFTNILEGTTVIHWARHIIEHSLILLYLSGPCA
ncbi:hypothetical protein HanHA300_Chr10g0355741 [Helianthus annuus]|nr:hypothetical protein HanHA300_Chr10g0355741 [Helianthus annuus]KAJ0521057.1 hypothetical protein HanIR_Chr10g0466441 [Helianthus annuus]KAJ0529393.1 hypothetical protein HanHA89_Chr10g0377331 [Helianthus annuus]KAJ0696280.1 hypothetical protein HanLR1_Chr10g0355241 [Helianthus annuus]